MKKGLISILIGVLSLTSISFLLNPDDFKTSFNSIIERVTLKTPAPNTEEMVEFLINKAKDDLEHSDGLTLKNALKYIKENADNLTKDNTTMENVIYYGAILQYSTKDKDTAIYTKVGMEAINTVKDVYIEDPSKNALKKKNASDLATFTLKHTLDSID